jgi:hypothetical protein
VNLSFSTLKSQLAADKKKAAILGVLFVVLLVVVGQLFMSDSAPQEAVAIAIVPPTAVVPPPTPADQNLVRPTPEPTSMTPETAPNGTGLVPTTARPIMTSHKTVLVDGMSRESSRDPFNTKSWDRFPLNSTPEQLTDEEKKNKKEEPGILDQLRQRIAAYQKDRKQETEKFTMEIDTLQLQSTLTGTRRSAYISGRLVHEGEKIDGFTVVRISDREVILSKGDARGSLQMP